MTVSTRQDNPVTFSWWLVTLPLVSLVMTVVFALVNFVWIPQEKRVAVHGLDAEAKVVRLWQEESRDAKGKMRLSSFVHLTWRTRDGETRTIERLGIGKKTFQMLEAQQKSGATTTGIRYVATGETDRPFPLVDLPQREQEWALAWWAMWGLALLTLGLIRLVLQQRRLSHS